MHLCNILQHEEDIGTVYSYNVDCAGLRVGSWVAEICRCSSSNKSQTRIVCRQLQFLSSKSVCVCVCVCSDMSSFSEEMEQKEREHKTEVEAMTNNRAMLEVWPQPTHTLWTSASVKFLTFTGKVSQIQQWAEITKEYTAEVFSWLHVVHCILLYWSREQELSGRLRESSPIGQYYYYLCGYGVYIACLHVHLHCINHRHTCAVRVTVLGSLVCLSVCLSVCCRVFCHTLNKTTIAISKGSALH